MCKQIEKGIIPPRIKDMIERYVEYGRREGGDNRGITIKIKLTP